MDNYITEITKQLNTESAQQTRYGVSEEGSTLIYGYPSDECALIFTKQDDGWVFQQKLAASDGVADDYFGGAVSISSDGSTVLIGADGNSSHKGAAYIFTRSGMTWIQQAKLVASDGATGDDFGTSVSISLDGSTTIVGAQSNSSYTGAAYVFTRSGSTWTQQEKLTASDGAAGDFFGWSVSLSSDGSTVLIGADGNSSHRGAAYIFTRSGVTWIQQAKLVASDAAGNDYFGQSVSISSDGNVIKILNINNKEYTFTLVDGVWIENS